MIQGKRGKGKKRGYPHTAPPWWNNLLPPRNLEQWPMGDFLFGDSGVRVVDQCGEIACLLSLTLDRAAFRFARFLRLASTSTLSPRRGCTLVFGCRVSGFFSFDVSNCSYVRDLASFYDPNKKCCLIAICRVCRVRLLSQHYSAFPIENAP